jgi:hypothetical protein
MSWLAPIRETVTATCDVDIEKTVESFHAYTVPSDIELRPGDEMLVHGVPYDIEFGVALSLQCKATVARATMLERVWTRVTSIFHLTGLYEVGFQPQEELELKPRRTP